MSWSTSVLRGQLVVLLSLIICGCQPSFQSALDEEKEPHFQLGKSRRNSLDYKGASEAFEKAIEANPRSASAHLELGLLCEKDDADCAAAIYHFDRYLQLRPNAENAEVIKSHVLACKQELAKTVSLGPVTKTLQLEFDQLADENRRLRDEVEKWRAYYKSGAGPTNPASGYAPPPRSALISTGQSLSSAGTLGSGLSAPRPVGNQPAALGGIPSAVAMSRAPAPPSGTHIYKLQSGENMAKVARKYGVKLEALKAANPGLDPSHLPVGQILNIPSP